MRSLVRILLAGLLCTAVAAGVVAWVLDVSSSTFSRTYRSPRAKKVIETSRDGLNGHRRDESRGREAVYDLVPVGFEDGGYAKAMEYMPPIRDPNSLRELREAVRG